MPTIQNVFQTDHPVALVTGSGAPRVGRAVATWLAQLNCHIALHANTSTDQAEAVAQQIRQDTGVQVIVVTGSFTDDEVPNKLVGQVHDQFSRIDVLVNSAAIWHPTPLEEVTAEEVKRYFEINSLSSLMAARAAGLIMVDQPRGGSIVNIGDWATVRPYLDHAAYFPSKGAVESMTRSLAVELGTRNPHVRVNCIQPGPVLLAEDVDEDRAQRVASSTLVRRVGSPDHVAHAVQFLCENEFVTGVCLPVDGGRTIYADDGLQDGLNTG